MHLRTVIFIVGVSVGILVGYHSQFASELCAIAFMLGSIELGLFFVARKRDQKGIALSLYLALISFGFLGGALRVQMVEEPGVFTCNTPCTFTARVLTSPERKDEYQLFIIHPLLASSAVYDINVKAPLYPQVRIGETYDFTGKVTLPATSFPHEGKDTFDYVSYLHTKGVGSEMMFPRMNLIDPDAHTVQDHLGRGKEELVGRLAVYVASPTSALAAGMLFGDTSLPQEVKNTFRIAGLSHIIVLSGFNIAIVISFMLLVLKFFPLVIRTLVASICTLAFVAMVGAEASVIRATLMSFIGLLAITLGRQYTARQSLILSFLIIILYDPFALEHDVSLHLSFLATAGILYFGETFSLPLGRYIRFASLRELLSTTTAAYVTTLPYIAYAFGSVSLYALLANVLVLPLVPPMMMLAGVTLLASYVHVYLAFASGWLVSTLGTYILGVAGIIASLPYASIAMSWWLSLFITVALGGGIYFLTRKDRINETAQTTKEGYLTGVVTY